jgi:hypothetical protein
MREETVSMGLPRPGKALLAVMGVLVSLWVMFAVAVNYGGLDKEVFFLFGCLMTGFLAQMAVEALAPRAIVASLGQPYWFGAIAAIEGTAVAWALSHRGQTVRLFFVLPVTATGLLVFVIGFSVFLVLANGQMHEGLITPFGGMLGGYLFGAGTPSPARRLFLKVRYFFMARRATKYRGKQPKLRIIEGGDSPPMGRRPPTDKRFLN